MPASLTYPGIYIEEPSSGVHTIMGISTSVTAFIGPARRGPVNKAIHILSFSDYQRRFGGLSQDSEMSYAIYQFFLNGGSEAWVVRVAKDPTAASIILNDDISTGVLKLTALDEGNTGNFIEVQVDYETTNPESTFNLRLNFSPPDSPGEQATEEYLNASMNSYDPRYIGTLVNGISHLVIVERQKNPAADGLGTSTSGSLNNGTAPGADLLRGLIDEKHKSFRVSVNGLPPVEITLEKSDIAEDPNTTPFEYLCDAIRTKISHEAKGEDALKKIDCIPVDNDKIQIKSGVAGETSNVRVLPGSQNDISSRLKLGIANGGLEVDAVAGLRPSEIPDHGTLTSGNIAWTDDLLPDDEHNSFQIKIDGSVAVPVYLGEASAGTLSDMADLIQTHVRDRMKGHPGFEEFTCTNTPNTNKLVLTSGSRGGGSSVEVLAAKSNNKDIAASLNLLNKTQIEEANSPQSQMLEGGREQDFTPNEAYTVYTGNGGSRKGFYALDEVDLFNIMCLPGVGDSAILSEAEAYCRLQRRAFLIIDSPKGVTAPDKMVDKVTGPDLPKSNYAAVYYPWVKISDPLKNGKLEPHSPCGIIAGLYARTDSTRGVWKAPAGIVATLTGVQSLEYALTDIENGMLNPLGVNCLRIFPVYGPVAWGARTLRGANQMTDEYKYIPVRRLALFIEESLFRGLKWVVFEPNDEPLWSQIRLNVGSFMHGLFRQGAFQGKSPKEAYFVKCDGETTTQDDINSGIVNILVGFAPLKPAEFVVVKLQQMAGQNQM